MTRHIPIIYDSDCIKITETIETYHRTDSGKSWRSKPTETETNVINARYYNNIMESRYFFHSRMEWGYTLMGYLPIRETSVSPTGDIKIIRKYKFERVE